MSSISNTCFLLGYLFLGILLISPLHSKSNAFVPLSEIRPGDILTAKTRIDNNVMHDFPVKVISIVRRSHNGLPSILAESDDPFILQTGVASGMSGSPVYVGKRLVGAIAYTWTFLKRPIMGITPIEEMLPIMDYQGKEPPDAYPVEEMSSWGNSGFPGSWEPWYEESIVSQLNSEYYEFLSTLEKENLALSRRIKDFRKFIESRQTAFPQSIKPVEVERAGQRNPISPILVSWSAPGETRRASTHSPFGWDILQEKLFPGIGASPTFVNNVNQGTSIETESEESLIPGDYIGINLVRGEIELNIYGTVTYVEGDTLLAFGHDIGKRGSVRLPLYKARTEKVVPLDTMSFKMGSLGKEIGTVDQDRLPGILGKIGTKATYLPVTLGIHSPVQSGSYRFEVANDRAYSSYLTAYAVGQVFSQLENSTLPVNLDYTIRLDYSTANTFGHSLIITNRISAPSAEWASYEITYKLTYVMNHIRENNWEPGQITNVVVDINRRPGFKLMNSKEIRVSRKVYRPGEEIRFQVGFDRYRKPRVYREFVHRIPADTPDGSYQLAVGSALTRWITESLINYSYDSRSLEEIVNYFKSIPPSNYFSIWSVGRESNIRIHNQTYSHLPANQQKILLRSPHNEKYTVARFRYRDYDLEEPTIGFLTLDYQVNRNYQD